MPKITMAGKIIFSYASVLIFSEDNSFGVFDSLLWIRGDME
jgi:hypothetical protein